MPNRSKDRLLVGGHKISAHKKSKQVAILPHLPELKIKKGSFGFDDEIPGVVRG